VKVDQAHYEDSFEPRIGLRAGQHQKAFARVLGAKPQLCGHLGAEGDVFQRLDTAKSPGSVTRAPLA